MQLPRMQKMSGDPSPNLRLPSHIRAERDWRGLPSYCESPRGGGCRLLHLQPGGGRLESLSCVAGARVPGGPLQERPGERAGMDTEASPRLSPRRCLPESCGPGMAPRAHLGEQGTPAVSLPGVDVRAAGAGVGDPHLRSHHDGGDGGRGDVRQAAAGLGFALGAQGAAVLLTYFLAPGKTQQGPASVRGSQSLSPSTG